MSVTVYIPREGMNTSIIDENIPGNVRGSVILKNVVRLEAPRSADASKSELLSFSIELYMGSTANGSMVVIIPTNTRPSVYTKLMGVSMKPVLKRTLFTGPLV
ncbi:hypothetical protein SDC9_164211 [bioreactor metagenome]|uniref:Uncharacterized protein n=1 Tax=bioreactor metagenome TaxID=1076179 RepID=A0A645FY97_9ZZZZ